MLFDYRYLGNSSVTTTSGFSELSFVPDSLREHPVAFRGLLLPQKSIHFREAISALHDVVVDDQRFVPKPRSDYQKWREVEEQKARALYMAESALLKEEIQDISQKILVIDEKIQEVRRTSDNRDTALQKYFDWLAEVNNEAWWVLDPVITVHKEDVFFECFSKDESSYGRLSCSYNIFDTQSIANRSTGTTNIDYSTGLYNEFQKIRDYRSTSLEIDPTGFNLDTIGEELYREEKIDVPETWVRGFLQVSASMALPACKVRLHPQDVYMLCEVLRQRKDSFGRRGLLFYLTPGEKVRIVFEPWGTEIVCEHSRYLGDEKTTIKVWGRRRLHVLERLIPVTQHFDLYLTGTGLPYFFVADLGDLQFTLGLSGWSTNNFSQGVDFSLLFPQKEVDQYTRERVFEHLKSTMRQTISEIASALSLASDTVHSALTSYMQIGRVVYDIKTASYLVRELYKTPIQEEFFTRESPEETAAKELLEQSRLYSFEHVQYDDIVLLKGKIRDLDLTRHTTQLFINADGGIVTEKSRCTCTLGKGKFRQGICRHLLALRLQYSTIKGS